MSEQKESPVKETVKKKTTKKVAKKTIKKVAKKTIKKAVEKKDETIVDIPVERVDLKIEDDIKKEDKQEQALVARLAEKGPDLVASANGTLQGRTVEEQYRHAKMILVSGMVDRKMYDTPEKVLAGLQFAYELNLPPLVSLSNIALINGRPTLWGELPLNVVKRSGKLEYCKEFTIDKDYEVICFANKNLHKQIYAAICHIKRVGEEEHETFYTQEDENAQKGGVKEIWNQYKRRMYVRKARSLALKDIFPDVLGGTTVAEYDYNTIVSPGKNYNLNHNGTSTQSERNQSIDDKFDSFEDRTDVTIEPEVLSK